MAEPSRPEGLYLGLMSGTSIDGVDAAIIRSHADSIELIAHHEHPMPALMRDQIASISHPGDDEIERLGVLDRDLGLLFAEAAGVLLKNAGIPPQHITAIGSHGQTIRHRPAASTRSFTLQIGDPNTIAEHTGITTVADFRRRDIAAGGEGAPLAPAFHAAAFAAEGENRAIINIGGISNVSLLAGSTLTAGFDTGPGNTLLDLWVQRHRGCGFDRDGEWAAGGSVCEELLSVLLAHPYLARTGPRSTGKEAFNLPWLEQCLGRVGELSARDVQATLAQFTARSIALGLPRTNAQPAAVFICGGGAHNRDLLQRIGALLPGTPVESTQALGISPDWVEAAAFAWLAQQTLAGLPGNAPQVTGAAGPRVLGGIFPGPS